MSTQCTTALTNWSRQGWVTSTQQRKVLSATSSRRWTSRWPLSAPTSTATTAMTITWHSALPVLGGLETLKNGTHATQEELATPSKKISKLVAIRQPLIACNVLYVTWATLCSHLVAFVRLVTQFTRNAWSAVGRRHYLLWSVTSALMATVSIFKPKSVSHVMAKMSNTANLTQIITKL